MDQPLVERVKMWWRRRRARRQLIDELEKRAAADLEYIRELTRTRRSRNGGNLDDLAESIERTVEEGQ